MSRTSRRERHRRFLLGGVAGLAILLPAAAVIGHGGRVSLFFWGTFPEPAVNCQRTIATSLNACAIDTLGARIACNNLELAGGQCDRVAINAAVEAARIAALDAIDLTCNEMRSAQLGFQGVIEIQADVSNACSRIDTKVLGALYPTPASPAAAIMEDQCQPAIALASARLLRFSNRIWESTFNRIARRNSPVTRSINSVAAARRRIAHAVDRLVPILTRECAAATFEAIYGRSAGQLLTEIAAQSECLAGASYVQNVVHCDPTPTPTRTRTVTATPTPELATPTPTAEP